MTSKTLRYKDLTRYDPAVPLTLVDPATIIAVKYQIKINTGIPIEQQTLFYRQNVLRDEDTLADLSIPENAVLKLLPRESIKVNVQTKQGRAASFRVRLSDTVSSVKTRIQQEACIFLGERCLSYAGKKMADDHVLSSYGLQSGSILTFDEEKTECYLELANGNRGEDSGILDSSSVESDRQNDETVSQLQTDIQLLQGELKDVQNQYQSLNEKGTRVEGALSDLKNSLSSKIGEVQNSVQDINGNQETLKLECLSHREKLNEHDLNVASALKEIKNTKDAAKRANRYIREKNGEIKKELEQKTTDIGRSLSETLGQVEEVNLRLGQVEENLSQVKELQDFETEERLKLQKELEESENIRKQFMQSFKGHQTLVDWVDNKLKGISDMSEKNLKVEIKSMRQDFTKKTAELDHTDDALAESLVRHKLESQEGVDFANCFQLKYCKHLKELFLRISYTSTCITDEREKKFKSRFLVKTITPIFTEYVSLLQEHMRSMLVAVSEGAPDQKQGVSSFSRSDLEALTKALQQISKSKTVENKVDAHMAVHRLRRTQGKKKSAQKGVYDDKTLEDVCKRVEPILSDMCPLEEEEYFQFHKLTGTKNVRPYEESKSTLSCYVHALLHKVLGRPEVPLDLKAPMELEVDVSGRVQEGTEENERIFTCGEFKARIKGNGAKAKEQTTNYVKVVAFLCKCLQLHLVKAKCLLYYLFGREATVEKPVQERLAYTFNHNGHLIRFVDENSAPILGDTEVHNTRIVYEKMKME